MLQKIQNKKNNFFLFLVVIKCSGTFVEKKYYNYCHNRNTKKKPQLILLKT